MSRQKIGSVGWVLVILFSLFGGEAQPATANKDADFTISLEDTLGVWRPVKDGDWPFVIVQEEPGSRGVYANRLEAHTSRRVWRGIYDPPSRTGRGGNKTRVVFRYRPRAEEMNPEIPQWARERVEGTLEWRIELSESGSIVDPHYTMKWFPGLVKWRDDADPVEATVEGEGKPYVIELAQDVAVELEQLANPTLWLEAADASEADLPEQVLVTQLLKHQPFRVKVRLPPAMAAKAGETIQIAIKGLTGSQSTTLTLQGHRVIGPHRPVVYTHEGVLAIADPGSEPDRSPKLLSIGWIADKYAREDGRRVDLWVNNGEAVEFRYGDTFQRVVVYENWMTEALDKQWDEAMAMNVSLQKILVDSTTPRAKREEAHTSQRLLANYFGLRARDDLHDLHKYYLGELYLSHGINGTHLLCTGSDCGYLPLGTPLVRVKPGDMDAMVRAIRVPRTETKYFTEFVKGLLEAVQGKPLEPAAVRAANAVPWTSLAEKFIVANTLATASDELSGLFQASVADTVLAAPLGFAEDLSIILFSRDLQNRAVVGWQRDVTIARFIAQTVLFEVAQQAAIGGALRLRADALRKLGTPSAARSTIRSLAKHRSPTQTDGFSGAADDLPTSVREGQIRETALRLDADPDTTSGPKCVRTVPPRARASGEIIIDVSALEAEQIARSIYGPQVEVVSDQLQPPQAGGTCVAAVGARLIKEGADADLGESGVLAAAATQARDVSRAAAEKAGFKNRILNIEYASFAGKRPTQILQEMFDNGVPTRLLRRILREQGADVAEVPIARNAKTNLRHVRAALDRDYQVFMAIDLSEATGKPDSFHAIAVTKLVQDGRGQIVKVRFFEPNLGREVQLPMAQFERLIARKNADGSDLQWGNMMVAKWDGRPWAATASSVAPRPTR